MSPQAEQNNSQWAKTLHPDFSDELVRRWNCYDQLIAERDTLRAVLRNIITSDPSEHPADWFQEWKQLVFRMKGIARAALEQKVSDDEPSFVDNPDNQFG